MQILIVVGLSILSFYLETFLFHTFGRFFWPNLSLILILFLNFSLGIRYSLLAAVLLGLLKDSLGTGFFGLNILSFVTCAFLATVLQRYIYQRGSYGARIVFMFVLVTIDFLVQFMFNIMKIELSFLLALRYVFLPEVLATLLVTNICFDQLKRCVLRFFVL
jgi:rod shape-determining protein MreD